MATFVKIESNGYISQGIVVADADCGGGTFPASEAVGQAFIMSLGLVGEWLQASEDDSFRGRYASVGWKYDAILDKFVAPVAPAG